MRLVFTKVAIFVSVLLGLGLFAGAAPAAIDSLSLLSDGQMNDFLATLMNRHDAESYNLRSRAYYATEQWDAAIENAEQAVNLRGDDSQYHLWLGRAYRTKSS